jgi:hypothetical protein
MKVIGLIISIDAEKAFDKMKNYFITKTLSKIDMEGMYLNKIKVINDKHTFNTTLNAENLNTFSFRVWEKSRVFTISIIQHNIGIPRQSN